MAIIVEDGTGVSGAESYLSVATVSAYHAAMLNTAWAAATTAQQEAALRKATQYVDHRYRFRGEKLRIEQGLEWPRDWWPNDWNEWPIKQLKEAVCELALRALSGSLYVDQEDRSVESETVGPISVAYGPSRFGGQVRYAAVDDIMKALTVGGRNSLRIEVA